jgi:DNA-binding IclR family transcriptional regulator
MCIGAPISNHNPEHYPFAAISLSVPLQRMQRELTAVAGQRLVQFAQAVSPNGTTAATFTDRRSINFTTGV